MGFSGSESGLTGPVVEEGFSTGGDVGGIDEKLHIKYLNGQWSKLACRHNF
jgi:hypothetical protein